MKIISVEQKQILDDLQTNIIFNSFRTTFIKSIIGLIVESIIPFIFLFIFYSPDINKILKYNFWKGFQFGLLTIAVSWILTWCGYFIKFHKSDQFTYTFSLSGAIFGFYLSGYWWNWNKILFRCLITEGLFFLSLLFGVFITILMNKFNIKKNYFLTKLNNK